LQDELNTAPSGVQLKKLSELGKTRIRRLRGSLKYIINCRPEVSLLCASICRGSEAALDESCLRRINGVFQYLKDTAQKGIYIPFDEGNNNMITKESAQIAFHIIAMCDASPAGIIVSKSHERLTTVDEYLPTMGHIILLVSGHGPEPVPEVTRDIKMRAGCVDSGVCKADDHQKNSYGPEIASAASCILKCEVLRASLQGIGASTVSVGLLSDSESFLQRMVKANMSVSLKSPSCLRSLLLLKTAFELNRFSASFMADTYNYSDVMSKYMAISSAKWLRCAQAFHNGIWEIPSQARAGGFCKQY
jgi:hypothetical protein